MKKTILTIILFSILANTLFAQSSGLTYRIDDENETSNVNEVSFSTDNGKTWFKSNAHKYTFYRDTLVNPPKWSDIDKKELYIEKAEFGGGLKCKTVIDTGLFIYYLKNIINIQVTPNNEIILYGRFFRDGQYLNYNNEYEKYYLCLYIISTDNGRTWEYLTVSPKYINHTKLINVPDSLYPYGYLNPHKFIYFYSRTTWYVYMDIKNIQNPIKGNGKVAPSQTNQFLFRTTDGGKTFKMVLDENGNTIKQTKIGNWWEFSTKKGYSTFIHQEGAYKTISKFLINENTGKCISLPLK